MRKKKRKGAGTVCFGHPDSTCVVTLNRVLNPLLLHLTIYLRVIVRKHPFALILFHLARLDRSFLSSLVPVTAHQQIIDFARFT